MGPHLHTGSPPAAIVADLEAAGLTASVSLVQLLEQYIVVGVRR